MSTRASYTFTETGSFTTSVNRRVVIYKHCDGYPEGAAIWISNAYDENETGFNITPESFIRANENARFTDRPHGDEEYRYFIKDGDFVTVKHRDYASNNPNEWTEIFNGTINEFLAKYPDFLNQSENVDFADQT